MKRYAVAVQENGRMVLPAELRKVLGLVRGDKVIIESDGDTVVLTTPERSRRRARELFRRHVSEERSLTDEVIADRRAEAACDAASDDDDAATDERLPSRHVRHHRVPERRART